MVDVTLPNGQVLSMPSVTDPEQAKRIAANYYRKNFAAPAEIDRSGVKDYGIRNYLAKADNDEEYRLRLGQMGFTPDMYVADPQGGYALNLDAIPANLKRQYGLEGTGLRAIEDEKAFTKQDITEFFSASAGPLTGSIAASLAATGVGILPAMAVAGAGGAIGYLMDEGFEYASGVQAEPIATVGRQAALEAVAAPQVLERVVDGSFLRALRVSSKAPEGTPQMRLDLRSVPHWQKVLGPRSVRPTPRLFLGVCKHSTRAFSRTRLRLNRMRMRCFNRSRRPSKSVALQGSLITLLCAESSTRTSNGSTEPQKVC